MGIVRDIISRPFNYTEQIAYLKILSRCVLGIAGRGVIEGQRRVDTPQTSYFPEIHLIEILRWPFVVVETLEKAHLTENSEG